MGFYQPAQIVIDARNHGVEVAPVDVNLSDWDNLLEVKSDKIEGKSDHKSDYKSCHESDNKSEGECKEKSGKYCVLRLGFRQIKGMQEDEARLLVSHRGRGFKSVQALRECGVSDATLERLADADAFGTIGLDRRQALWQVTVKEKPTQVFRGAREHLNEHIDELPGMLLSEHVIQDYASTSLSLKAHPVSFVREQLSSLHVVSASELASLKDGDKVKVAGLILVRQRPGTASGICFITIEDETGCANLVVFEKLFNQYRPEILQSSLLMVEGKLQREGEVIHVIVSRCFNYSKLLRQLTPSLHEDLVTSPLSRADERSAVPDARSVPDAASMEAHGQGRIFPEGRNFR
jgi:error-prone DNA polymerase